MKHEIHKLTEHLEYPAKSLTPVLRWSQECGEYRWTQGSNDWRYVTCERCLKKRPKRDRRQGRLF